MPTKNWGTTLAKLTPEIKVGAKGSKDYRFRNFHSKLEERDWVADDLAINTDQTRVNKSEGMRGTSLECTRQLWLS